MINPKTYLKKWLHELNSSIGDEIPDASKTSAIANVIKRHFGTDLVKFLGAGDNGIAFKTSDGDVIKFTIDRNEAMLWNRIRNQDVPGIVKLKDVVNLRSSITGQTYVYIVRVEMVAKDLSDEQSDMVRKTLKTTMEKNTAEARRRGPDGSRIEYIKTRSQNFIEAFSKLAEIDPAFEHIPQLLVNMARKQQSHLFDLKPDNFKVNQDGKVVLIDPSVPDIIGDVTHPDDVLFEDIVNLSIDETIMLV